MFASCDIRERKVTETLPNSQFVNATRGIMGDGEHLLSTGPPDKFQFVRPALGVDSLRVLPSKRSTGANPEPHAQSATVICSSPIARTATVTWLGGGGSNEPVPAPPEQRSSGSAPAAYVACASDALVSHVHVKSVIF